MVVVGVRLWDSERNLWRFQTRFQNSAYSASLWGVVFFFFKLAYSSCFLCNFWFPKT